LDFTLPNILLSDKPKKHRIESIRLLMVMEKAALHALRKQRAEATQ